ncbi:alkyl hydroperoxide reductase [Scheffersomyces xylosifermentans]|uniref:alkyl hydroperoxide reductase n=1 Tax=Scheffersomyces xylosifermentans TaxID=1304137 RepID=UPI00315DC146
MTLGVGDKFPTSINPKYVPYTKENDKLTACANPIELNLAKEFAGKTVVVTAVPGAFTPTCTEQHIPDYLKNLQAFKDKGVSRIIVLSANDPFVLSAWGKALGYKEEENFIVFANDPLAKISSELGDKYTADLSSVGFGVRTARYAGIVVDGKITFLQNEDELGFTEISSSKNILDRI